MAEEPVRVIGKDLLTCAQASQHLAKEFLANQDWSGVAMPVLGLNLVLEPRYKHKGLENFRWKEYFDQDGNRYEVPAPPNPQPSDLRRVNVWWSAKYQANIHIYRDKSGRAQGRLEPVDRLSFILRTLEAAAAWPVEAEQKAQKKLATLISDESFEIYTLTGQFYEISERSQVTYLFRRGRPTIAMRETDEGSYWLCALCLHPIGYYGETWAGVMCPTDEVIAHLLMMRGSEEKFWANANQHSVDHPAAGV